MACIRSGRFCVRVFEKLCQSNVNIRKPFFKVHGKYGFQQLRAIGYDCQKHSPATTSAALGCSWRPSNRPDRGGPPPDAPPLQTTGATGTHHNRSLSTMHTQQPGTAMPEYHLDPYRMLEDDLKIVYDDIRLNLIENTYNPEVREVATYYFDGLGKALRPMVALLMSRAINYHIYNENNILSSQRDIASICEMIHAASLIHDDVIDQSDFRRGKPSANVLWNHKKVAMAGDYIISIASLILARIRNDTVTVVISQITTDLVQGEFMQLGSKETENERFAHYLQKTYRKTASLIANMLKAEAILAGADEKLVDLSFQYGRNIGLAFQLVDDLLDFVSSSEAMGKPTAADLKLGLATAPVLFACEKYPELNPMIMRRFQEPGDVERAFELVHKSQGLEQTQFLARQHCLEANKLISQLRDSRYQKALQTVSDLVINRMK